VAAKGSRLTLRALGPQIFLYLFIFRTESIYNPLDISLRLALSISSFKSVEPNERV
jgi:hypothetical protein